MARPPIRSAMKPEARRLRRRSPASATASRRRARAHSRGRRNRPRYGPAAWTWRRSRTVPPARAPDRAADASAAGPCGPKCWLAGLARVVEMRAAAQELRQRQHHHHADDADRHVGRAPAIGLDGALHEGRPDGAGDVVAAGHDGDRDAAPAQEPLRDIGHQRAEGGGTSEQSRSAPPAPPEAASSSATGRPERSPRPAPRAAIDTGTMMPNRSATLPMVKPPSAKPMKVTV